MDIWTERLERTHLTLLERWLGRSDGVLTANDLPEEADSFPQWFEACEAERGREDYLILVYETPVGIAGLRRNGDEETAAELYLLIGEVGYNLLRTATYAALRVLDRAFLEPETGVVTVSVLSRSAWFAEVLERMGFSRSDERDGVIPLRAERKAFLNRKHLF